MKEYKLVDNDGCLITIEHLEIVGKTIDKYFPEVNSEGDDEYVVCEYDAEKESYITIFYRKNGTKVFIPEGVEKDFASKTKLKLEEIN